MSADIARLDVPLPVVKQEIAAQVLRESQARHAALGNVDEAIADGEALQLITHPELIPSESGDPVWDAWLAARIADHAAAWAAAHTNTAGGTA